MKTPVTLTSQGCDRATAYHQANKIVRTPRGVFVTWLDSDYRCVLAQLDEEGKVVQQYPIAQAFDNHCGAAMTMTPDGVVHVVSGSHHMGFLYLKSATPWDKGSWSLPEVVGQTATYPSLTHTTDGVLHLAHRRAGLVADEHWGVAWHATSQGRPWGAQKGLVWRMPAPLYSYPTNSLAAGPDGTMHMVIEWYKTWSGNVEAARSLGVSHFEMPAGPGDGSVGSAWTWRRADGGEIKSLPIKFEESQPLAYPGGEDPRPGNAAVLPDGRPIFGVWNAMKGTVSLVVRQGDKRWKAFDLSPQAQKVDGGKVFCGQPQLGVNDKGQVVMVVARGETSEWGAPATQLHVFVIDPELGQVIKHEAIPKQEPDQPDWLASLEKPGAGVYPPTLHLIYQTGVRGKGCVNQAICRVNHVVVG